VIIVNFRSRNAGRPEEFEQVRLLQVDDQRPVGLLCDLKEALHPVGVSHRKIHNNETVSFFYALFGDFFDLLFTICLRRMTGVPSQIMATGSTAAARSMKRLVSSPL
jgi:hypothetical protein